MNLKKINDSAFDPRAELNSLYAEELQAAYNYFHVVPFLVGENRPSLEEEFWKHAEEELEHAKWLLVRINELFMECTVLSLSEVDLTATTNPIVTGFTVVEQAQANADAERAAIDHYSRVLEMLGDSDPVTSDLLKKILAVEETHYREMIDFVDDITK